MLLTVYISVYIQVYKKKKKKVYIYNVEYKFRVDISNPRISLYSYFSA